MPPVDSSFSSANIAAGLLNPLRGKGPNTYLAIHHFWAMIGMAILVHISVLGVYSLLPEPRVQAIPVHVLSFRLGGQERIAAYGLQAAFSPPPEPADEAVPATLPTTTEESPAPNSVEKPASTTLPPAVNAPTARLQPQNTPTPKRVVLPKVPESAPAISATPQRFVRENGLPQLAPILTNEYQKSSQTGAPDGTVQGQGSETIISPSQAETIRKSYEQQISVWIERHRIYPVEAGNATGRVLLRVRFDRAGYLRYSAIERSSGNGFLDRAAMEMIRRANPVPAVPENYPAGNLIEFLIPVLFEAPR
jgi:protein TonB